MRVLFVEDDPMNRRVVRDMLTVAGIALEEATDGRNGLDMIESGDYSVILMDLRMPGMDGMEAIRLIRARADHKAQLPIVVVTADTSADIRADCLRNGADELLMKPVAMQPLFKTMAATIARKAKSLKAAGV
jgi:CheY-like chemotaxis protein